MNALAAETSPYLLQHAANPVAWYPWGPSALAQARAEDKPILLSIGYSACHWCHVMAHESFEDPVTAELMNRCFINIKVDREERPDLDKIYQAAHQLLSRRNGGWPLTVFLTPDDQTPFFSGTYFPVEPRYGLPGFRDVLQRIADLYRQRRAEITEQNHAVQAALNRLAQPGTPGEQRRPSTPDPELLHEARRQLERSFDPRHGGFGQAPKFPQSPSLDRLLRHYASSCKRQDADEGALQMVLQSLEQMAQGGMYDQLAGGFCRYSVDERWMIPHFEKMLYDNGPLLTLYSQAWQITGRPLFRKTALETADWVLRDMQAAHGGFFSSLDADSEGHEGKFYVWDRAEIESLLDADSYRLFARHFGLDREANFEGRWHLHVYVPIAQLSAELQQPEAQVVAVLDRARQTVLAVRNRRPWPARDEKILVSWNALMIKALAITAQVFDRSDYLHAARASLHFIREKMFAKGRLLATARADRAQLNAYLDDYALLLDALLSLQQSGFQAGELEMAVQLADTLLLQFEDPVSGGFYFTSHDHEQLLQRPKPLLDDAMPSGAAVATIALNRLGQLLGEPRYLDAAARALREASAPIAEYPLAHLTFLTALEEQLDPPVIALLRGRGTEIADWQQRCLRHYAPRRLCIALPDEAEKLGGTRALPPAGVRTAAYICDGPQCSAPIDDLTTLLDRLQASEVPQFNTRSE